MRRILQFLATDGAFLYESYHCRIVDSEYVPTFGGTGSVTVQNAVVELKFWLERDLLFLDVRAASKSKTSWFSFDIVRQLLSGETDKALMDAENVQFLKSNFASIQDRFTSAKFTATETAIGDLQKQRSRRLFGS